MSNRRKIRAVRCRRDGLVIFAGRAVGRWARLDDGDAWEDGSTDPYRAAVGVNDTGDATIEVAAASRAALERRIFGRLTGG